MTRKKSKGMVLGAVAGTLIGSLAALMVPSNEKKQPSVKKRAQDLLEKARHISEDVVEDIKAWQHPKKEESLNAFVTGAILGALLGAGSAALITPKSGKQLRKDLVNGYQGMSEKTHDVIEFIQENINHGLNHASHATKKKSSKLNLKKTGFNLKAKAKKAINSHSSASRHSKH